MQEFRGTNIKRCKQPGTFLIKSFRASASSLRGSIKSERRRRRHPAQVAPGVRWSQVPANLGPCYPCPAAGAGGPLCPQVQSSCILPGNALRTAPILGHFNLLPPPGKRPIHCAISPTTSKRASLPAEDETHCRGLPDCCAREFHPQCSQPRWPARLRQQLEQSRFIRAIPVTREGTRGAARTPAFSPDPSSRCPASSSPSLCSVHVSSSEPPLWASLLSSRWTGKHRPGGQRHG